MKKTYEIIKLGEFRMPDGRVRGRFVGVAEAARGLRVKPQSIYMVLGGYTKTLGPNKLARLVIVDATSQVTRH